MSTLLNRRAALLADPAHGAMLLDGLRGIERETLRVDRQGRLAKTAHPASLGAPLTHPHITTDYAEALLEFVTSAEPDIATALDELDEVHRFVYGKLGEELLWSQSMPCELPPEPEIAIAAYGSSHIGMLKHVYRRGLALRYGKAMQCIAGIHYNYSLSEKLWPLLQEDQHAGGSARDFQSASYFALIRNFRRYSWLLMYLFGASPALSACFLRDRAHQLETLSADTLYLPYATSLRMSDLGYQSNAQASLSVQFDNVDNYIRSLHQAVSLPYPPYAEIGTRHDGQWVQLNTNLLQIENEYYSTIRPKRVIGVGERALGALAARGVQYVEVRCLDVDPFEPVGISLQTSRFMDAFLLFCALEDSPQSPDRGVADTDNFASVVTQGRRPGLTLQRDGAAIGLQTWAGQLLEQIGLTAALLDAHAGTADHADALAAQSAKIDDVRLTPSSQVLEAMNECGNSFSAFGLRQSLAHAAHLRARPLSAQKQAMFEEAVRVSIEARQALEASQSGDFDAFVEAYLHSVRLDATA
ncbi:MAG: glutamate--cysteine ligase [Herminiimonas sp.]|nr:glutamate--cysteine ligase [Herminiimonas sp.]